MAFRKIKAGLVNADVGQFVGETGNLFFDTNDGALRLSDGVTPGGNLISSGGSGYTLPTASTTTKGGVKVDGTTITINNQVISATQQDLSSYATETFVTTRGYLTSYSETDPVFLAHAAYNVTNTKITNWDTAYGWGNHASAGYLTSVGTISYNDLSNKPTIPTTVTVNGTAITLGSSGTVTAAAGTLTGSTLASGVTASSLTSVGTLNGLSVNGTAGGNVLIVSGTGRPSNGNIQTWKFYTNTNIGGPGSYIEFPDSTLQTTAWTGNATTVTNGVYTTDTGTVTNTMLAGSIANDKLANSSITVNGTSISLGGTGTISLSSLVNGSYTLSVNSDGTVTQPNGMFNTGTNQAILWSTNSSGAGATYRTASPASGQPYQGTAYTNSSGFVVTQLTGTPGSGLTSKAWTFNWSGGLVFPDATTQTTAYTGNAATVTNGVYTTDTATVTNTMLAGSIANSKLANSSITVNGTSIALGSSATITAVAAAGTLTGSTLASGVTASSLTSVGTLTSLTSSGVVNITNNTDTTLTGNGALVVNGGIGIGGGITMGGSINASGSVNAVNFVGTGSVNANGGTVDSNAVTGNLFATPVTVNFAAAATAVNIGATTGTTTIRNPVVLFSNAETIRSTPSTLSLFNVNATTINFAGDATTLNIGAATGTTTINNALSVGSSVTANAATAFIAGSNAISNVSLQMPSESALRNLTNGATNMYFDVSIGGSTHGAFQFRSSSSYTNVLTMSPTAVSFNTGAAVTARTPAMARTAFNAAIDTEITVDNMRFRVSNQGGVFPQVIGNGSSRNLAWTAVGAISTTAINQVGSTGTIVASNAWTTLYNTHGMDASGDTVTVTLQDKGLGAIYRITFMRSDSGGTGYNIIGERIL